MQTNKRRNSNIELLRIIAIILITFNHVATKGIELSHNVICEGWNTELNNFLALFYSCGGKFGSNIFLIITVWYISDKKTQWTKIVSVWYQTLIYYLFFNIVGMIIDRKFDVIRLVKSFFPIITSNYWYSRAYIMLLLVFPVVTRIFNRIKHKREICLLGTFVFLIPIVSNLVNDSFHVILKISSILSREELWFIFFAVLIYYIRNNIRITNIPAITYLLLSIALYILMWIIVLVCFYNYFPYSIWRNLYSPLNYLSALFLFLGFIQLPVRHNVMVNYFAGYVYGVYLFQCHNYVQTIIWKGKFGIFQYQSWYGQSALKFAIYSVISVCIIVMLGAIFEMLYKKILIIPLKEIMNVRRKKTYRMDRYV